MKVYVNGKILDENKAVISVFDRSFLYGDGLFETMRSYGGIIFRLGDHLDRLYSSMKSLKMRQGLSRRETEKAVYDLLRVNHLKDASVRITVSRGASKHKGFGISQNDTANVIITAGEFMPRPAKYYTEGIKVDIARRFRKNNFTYSTNFKTTNYIDSIIARNEAVAKGSFETIFLNGSGCVCEGSVSNIFMIRGNRLMTPSTKCGVLPGITRKAVLELAPYAGMGVQEGEFTEEELKSSNEVFVTNSLIEVIAVVKVDDRRIGGEKVGAITRKIHGLYKDMVKKETKK